MKRFFFILVMLVVAAAAKAEVDGRFFRLFMPFTFYHQQSCDSVGNMDDKEIVEAVNNTMLNIYLKRPDLVVESERNLQKVGGLKSEKLKVKSEKLDSSLFSLNSSLSREASQLSTLNSSLNFEVEIKKPNFWSFSQEYYLQLLQNFFSDNWYKAGETNYSLLGNATLQMNYNNKQKIKFDNKLELKFGMQTNEGDTLHKVRTSSDLIRYTGKLGVQATKQWYYSCQLIAYTQFARGYKANDKKVYSDFMSPFNANVSLGMEYAIPTKYKKKVTGTLSLSPLAYNFRYVDRLDLATRYSLEEGRHTLHDFGSSMTFNFKWTPSDKFSYETRLWAYTTYERSEMEWENTFTIKLAKYISAKLFLYPRFDDATARDEKMGYFQFKEYTSIGFSYSL